MRLPAPPLPASGVAGADEWSSEGDLAVRMMDWAHRLVDRKIAEMPAARPSRSRLLELAGAVDPRVPPKWSSGLEAAVEPGYRITQVRWSVLEGVAAEGLWIRARGAAVGRVIALGDAGQTPEQLCGLMPGLAPEDQFAPPGGERLRRAHPRAGRSRQFPDAPRASGSCCSAPMRKMQRIAYICSASFFPGFR